MAGQYLLPHEMRAGLARPKGKLFSSVETKGAVFAKAVASSSFVVTVGDRVTETLGGMGRVPDVQIVDAKENRNARELPNVPFAELHEVRNPAGSITEEAIEGIRRAFQGRKPARVLVNGEEDLLAMPALVLAPPSASLFYGQPGQGIVMITADTATKSRNMAVMKKMGLPDKLLSPNR